MAKNLILTFSQGKRSKSLSLSNPKLDLHKSDVLPVMQDIVDKHALLVKGADDAMLPVDGIKDAYYKETIITPLAE